MPEMAMLEIATYMNTENVLPEDFDGVFRFTNWTDADFTGKWDSKEYIFPANKTSPMIISGATPEEVQNIRKKFARDLAIQEFYKSDKFQSMNAHIPGGTPALYTDSDIAPLVQKCLNPLPTASAKVIKAKKIDIGEILHKDEEGNNVTRILKGNENLTGQAA